MMYGMASFGSLEPASGFGVSPSDEFIDIPLEVTGKLNLAQLQALVDKANFWFEVDLGDNSDSYVVVGDGVDDLEQVIELYDRYPLSIKMLVDVGTITFAPVPIVRADVVAMRILFITKYGNVDKAAYVGTGGRWRED